MSYTVALMADRTGTPHAPWGAFLLFISWTPGDPKASGHLESGFLVTGANESAVLQELGALPLVSVKTVLDGLIDASHE